jgi:hypothetical protein
MVGLLDPVGREQGFGGNQFGLEVSAGGADGERAISSAMASASSGRPRREWPAAR